ncbi:hypothetical protein DE4585_03852 [Mycobacteroides salmoniphilum]|uniref:Uncharacterized protein n=1 Tax=Mycobacteroides salmoniphilum TaxID=404941 RepID=A0A4R8RZX0_9MYCO|nr:hypothetical protein DE4585_03852 [Mycobacteroides salmoniphilum]
MRVANTAIRLTNHGNRRDVGLCRVLPYAAKDTDRNTSDLDRVMHVKLARALDHRSHPGPVLGQLPDTNYGDFKCGGWHQE